MAEDGDKTRRVINPPDEEEATGPKTSADRIGTVLAGRYRIAGLLGEGAQGTVYVGEHLKIGRKDAIKILRPELLSDTDAVARFTRGASKASHISHPNVCTVYDFGETSDGLPFMASELVTDGEELHDVIQREAPFDLDRAIDIVEQTAAGLQAAHEIDIVHRDLKPANIMLTRSRSGREVVKVVDFDIAKGIGEQEAGDVTQAGWIIGTPKYMSPEQITDEGLDGRTDIYSLALIFFEMVTGDLPNEKGSTQKLMWARVNNQNRSLSDVRPDLDFPPGLQEVIDQALSADREKRPQSAPEFARQLREVHEAAPAASTARTADGAEKTAAPATRVDEPGDIPATRVEAPDEGRPGRAEEGRNVVPIVAGGVTVVVLGVAAALWSGVFGGAAVPTLSVPDGVEVAVDASSPLDVRLLDAATGDPLAGDVSYTTGDVNVAAVDASGLVRGLAPGSTFVIVRSGELADTVDLVVHGPTRTAAADGAEDEEGGTSAPQQEGQATQEPPTGGTGEEEPTPLSRETTREAETGDGGTEARLARIHRRLNDFSLNRLSDATEEQLMMFRDTTAVLWSRPEVPDSTKALVAYLQAQTRARLGEAPSSWCPWARRATDASASGERVFRAASSLLRACPGQDPPLP